MAKVEWWLDIEGYEGLYKISSFGRILALPRLKKNPKTSLLNMKSKEKILSFGYVCGYAQLILTDINGVQTQYKVHRLVAMHFIPNLDNKPMVNHKDGNKANNHFTNLEWCTALENVTHANKTGLVNIRGARNINSKYILCKDTGIYYECTREAAIAKNMKQTTLRSMLNGNNRNKTNLIYV